MKYFTDFEIFRSIYLSIIFGVFLSCISISAESFLRTAKRIFCLPADVFRIVRNFSIKRLNDISNNNFKNKKSNKVNNVYDAIMFSLFGVSTVIFPDIL